jgi:hypothetical protein
MGSCPELLLHMGRNCFIQSGKAVDALWVNRWWVLLEGTGTLGNPAKAEHLRRASRSLRIASTMSSGFVYCCSMTRYKSPTALHSLNEMRIAPCSQDAVRTGGTRTLTVYQFDVGLAGFRHSCGRRERNSFVIVCRIRGVN